LLCGQLNLDGLLAAMWETMGLVRVFTKPQGQHPDFSEPIVMSHVSHSKRAVTPDNYLAHSLSASYSFVERSFHVACVEE
jgi:ribosome-interacting GTPase 1